MSISDVIAEYERIRENNEVEEKRRRQEVYKIVPELYNFHRKINELQKKRMLNSLSGSDEESQQIASLRKTASDMLVGAGFCDDYLEHIYSCPACRDTGMTGSSQQCDCFKKRILEDKLDAARLTDIGISFEEFDINFFSDIPIENGKSQKDQMANYKRKTEIYADSFPVCSPILIFTGGIGLGKTYLAKCVMRRVIERGYTAAYYTAYRLFSMFHRHRLGDEIDLDPVFEVPLLIIDDIGTEQMTRNVTIEYFFDLINERSGLHTIIVTNLPLEDINARYGERIHSRLMDIHHSTKIIFRGEDVRAPKSLFFHLGHNN